MKIDRFSKRDLLIIIVNFTKKRRIYLLQRKLKVKFIFVVKISLPKIVVVKSSATRRQKKLVKILKI